MKQKQNSVETFTYTQKVANMFDVNTANGKLMHNACSYAKTQLKWDKAIAGGELYRELIGEDLKRGEVVVVPIAGLKVHFTGGWQPGKRKQLTGMPIYKA